MANWDLTLDQSCFEDWGSEKKLSIAGNDVTDIHHQLSGLDEADASSEMASQLEDRLIACLPCQAEDDDVLTIIQLAWLVSRKLSLLPRAVTLLSNTCRSIFLQVARLSDPAHLRQFFECLEGSLDQAQSSCDAPAVINIFEIVELAYSTCSRRSFDHSEELLKLSSKMCLGALSVVEKQTINMDGEIVRLLKLLISIGQFSCRMDAKSMALIWKLVLKMLQSHPQSCRELQLGACVVSLVQEVFHFFELVRQNVSIVSKFAKICGFLIKVILSLIEKDPPMLERPGECEAVIDLVLQLHKFTPDVVKTELAVTDELVKMLEQHLTVAIHPLAESLMKTRQLLPGLRKTASQCMPENRLSFVRLVALLLTPIYQTQLVDAVAQLPELLDVFLSGVDQSHGALSDRTHQLFGVVHSGHGAHLVPVYELLVTQACSGMAAAPPLAIPECVGILFYSVTTAGFWAFLMAADILSFMARYGSSQFSLDMVENAILLCLSSAVPNSRLICLVSRLVAFLSPAGRASLLKSHPPDKHPDLWATLHWKSFSVEQQTMLGRSLVPAAVSSSQPPRAGLVLRLHSLCSANNALAFRDRTDIQSSLVKLASALMTGLAGKSLRAEQRRNAEYLLAGVVRVLLKTVQPDQKEHHLQLMQVLKCATDASKTLPLVLLEVTEFLGAMGPTGVAASPQQPAILRVLANLFCESTASRSFLVQIAAFRAFELFFSVTPHAQLASSSVRDDTLLKQFISRRPTRSPSGGMAAFWQAQSDCLAEPPRQIDPIAKPSPTDNDPTLSNATESFPNCPTAKRPRLETDEQLHFLMNNLDKVVADIGQLCPLPAWSKDEIRERVNLLNSYL